MHTAQAVSEAMTNDEPITESMQYVYPLAYPMSTINLCNCVLYVESILGIKYLGVANTIPVHHFNRSAKLVVTNEGKYGHVALVLKIENGLLYLKEANYKHCQESERILPIDSKLIRGYY